MEQHFDDDVDSVASEYLSFFIEIECVDTGADDPAEDSEQTVHGVTELGDLIEFLDQEEVELEYHVDEGCVAKHIPIIGGKVNIRTEPDHAILDLILSLELMQCQRKWIRNGLLK